MNEKLRQFLESIVPFFVLGIVIALVIGFFIMFSYLLIWGLIIGGFLWIIIFIKNLLFPRKKLESATKGRIIDYKDKK